jgi:hypothetical protein
MKNNHRASKLLLRAKEIEVKDLLIFELLKAITENKIKLNVETLKIINQLYAGKKVG